MCRNKYINTITHTNIHAHRHTRSKWTKDKQKAENSSSERHPGHWMIFVVSGLILYLRISHGLHWIKGGHFMVHVSIPTGQKAIFDKISVLPKHELLDDYNVGHRSSSDRGKCVWVILQCSSHFFMKSSKLGLRLSHGPAEIRDTDWCSHSTIRDYITVSDPRNASFCWEYFWNFIR